MLETLSEQRCHGGVQGFYRHTSDETGTPIETKVLFVQLIARQIRSRTTIETLREHRVQLHDRF